MSQEVSYNKELHSQLIDVGKKLERGSTHRLEEPFIETLLATLEYYGASQNQLRQVHFDLVKARYKIFDALGMWYTGRLEDPNNTVSQVQDCLEKMVRLYILQSDVGGFAWFLRGHDLDIEEPVRCEDCIKSYHDWRNEK